MTLPAAGSSALRSLGIVPVPIGTPTEVREAGLDPAHVASCAPPGPGVRGCAHWADCPFNRKSYGGFKTQGPKNVGYYLHTDDDTKKEDFISCYGFTKVLLARMRFGAYQREQGKPGDLIRIVAQEGEKILRRVFVKKNPEDKRPEAEYEELREIVTVPAHPRPKDNPGMTYDQLLRAREQERMLADEMMEDQRLHLMSQMDPTPKLPVDAEDPEDGHDEIVTRADSKFGKTEPATEDKKD